MLRQNTGPATIAANKTSASMPSWSCSLTRCSGEPVPAASATLRPKGCQVPSARPARRSRKFASKQRLALDHQGVAAIGQMDGMRGAVAVFLRHPMHPPLGRHFEMPVARHQIVFPRHRHILVLRARRFSASFRDGPRAGPGTQEHRLTPTQVSAVRVHGFRARKLRPRPGMTAADSSLRYQQSPRASYSTRAPGAGQ